MFSVALAVTAAEAAAPGRYPAPCFQGARTFLPRFAAAVAVRPSGFGTLGAAARAGK